MSPSVFLVVTVSWGIPNGLEALVLWERYEHELALTMVFCLDCVTQSAVGAPLGPPLAAGEML